MTVYPQIRTCADFLKSTIRINELIPFLQTQKAKSCAIVNTKLYGILPFYHQLKKASIHPVIGLTVQVQFSEQNILPLILYAETNEGYKNLLKISSSISIRDDELLPFKWLAGYSKGCIAIIPIVENHGIWLQQKNRQSIEQLKNIFQHQLFIAISRIGGEISPYETFALELSEQFSIPIIASHPCFYLHKEDQFPYEVARCIDLGVKLSDYEYVGKMNNYHVPTEQEWHLWFSDKAEWLKQSEDLLLRCQVDLKYEHHYMPSYPLPKGVSAKEVLRDLAFNGLKERLQTEHPKEVYIKRLQYELDVIISMGYEDYFLIVSDILKFARSQHILTGPGRGSSASSLVAYSLYITQVDPIKYGLLFERFLNPERITLPDIDIDFVDTRRNEIIQYVAKKFGQKNVAQIITYGTLSAKAVARDVARMFNFETETLDMISKFIPNRIGITLQEVYETSEPFRTWIEQEEIRKKWFHVAKRLEGLPRNSSTHAAGVVICPTPLVDVVPIEKGHDDIFLTQWPMEEVEQVGLLKMDFLGLRNLTIIEQIIQSIRYTYHKEIDLLQIPLNDPKTFALLQNGDTNGIFQLESEGMKIALREIAPTHFLDIVAVNALHRPGPKEFIPMYARRKKGMEKVDVLHPLLEPILNETFGIIVYQEQIMQIANKVANFSLGEADVLRRAVSKKNRDILEENRTLFVQRAVQNGISQKVASDVYELIVRFADYGFAKSHAVAYSLISYQMAYLKANYPLNFYACLMTSSLGNQEKLFQFILEARAKGIEILPPSIQKSKRIFTVENGKIRFSLSAIKGVSQNFLQKLLTVREEKQQPFESLFDLAESVSAVHFNRKNIEPLIKAGALDDFGKDRATLLASIDIAESHAKIVSPDEEENLFTGLSETFGKPKYHEANPIPEKLKLQYEWEVLGFYLSEHPVSIERKKCKFPTCNTNVLKNMNSNTFVKLIGLVENIRQIRTKKGELMAFVQLQDEFGSVSATLFPKQYNQVIGWLKEEQVVLVEGVFEKRFGKPTIKVNSIKHEFL